MVAFAGCIGAGGKDSTARADFPAAERPVWKSGYTFTYSFTSQAEGSGKSEGGHGGYSTETGPVVYSYEVLNTRMKNGDSPVYVVGVTRENETIAAGADEFTSAWFLSSNIFAFRQRDLMGFYAYVPSLSCPECSTLDEILFQDDTNRTFLEFPLAPGSHWSTEEAGQEFYDIHYPGTNSTGRVVGAGPITVDGAEVLAIEVEILHVPVGTETYLKDLRREIESEGFRVQALEWNASILERVWYAPSLQAVARSVIDYDEAAYTKLDPTTGENDPVDYHDLYRYHAEQDLLRANITEVPERGLDAIRKIALDVGPVASPGDRYTLNVVTDNEQPNAAQTPTVTFTADVVGAQKPLNHTARWALFDYYGEVVESGEGLSFEHRFAQPGSFWVAFETRDATGEIVATASLPYAVHYQDRITASCPLAAREPSVHGCTAAPLTFGPGLSFVSALADIEGETELTNADFRLVDARGEIFQSKPSDGSGIYEIWEYGYGLPVSQAETWTVQWYQELGVGESATYDLFLYYQPSYYVVHSIPPPEGSTNGANNPFGEPHAWARMADLKR